MGMSRRICITGIGLVCPLGCGVNYVWKRIMAGHSGIVSTDQLENLKGLTKSRVAGLVPKGHDEGQFDPKHAMFSAKMPRVNPKSLSMFAKYALFATKEALEDADLCDKIDDLDSVGVSIGNGIGALDGIEEKIRAYSKIENPDPASVLRAFGPYYTSSVLPNLGAGNVSMYFGFRGPNRSVNTACASGLYSIDDGCSMIRNGDAKIAVVGGTESSICVACIAGFDAMTALSRKYNDTPEKASRPYDKNRDGFVLAEGSGILILEDMEHAMKRNAKIYAEYLGAGLTSDAYNVSAPSGEGSAQAMEIALRKAGLKPEQIDYIGTHATSTPVGDRSEIESIRKVFGDKIPTISATKSSIGHTLGAASGVEAVLLMKTLETGEIPPSLNIENPEDFMDGIDYVPDLGRKQKVEIAMKNSFGFGGANASAIFRRFT